MNTPLRSEAFTRLFSRAHDRQGRALKVSLPDLRVWVEEPPKRAPIVTYERRTDAGWGPCVLDDLAAPQYRALVEYVVSGGWSADARVRSIVVSGATGRMTVTLHDGTEHRSCA